MMKWTVTLSEKTFCLPLQLEESEDLTPIASFRLRGIADEFLAREAAKHPELKFALYRENELVG